MRWTPMLVLAVVASVAPAWAEDQKAADTAETTTTTLPKYRRRGLVRDPRGLPTGLPDFGTPSVPIEGAKPGHEPESKPATP